MIFVYTDGVTEAINPAEERFGEERLMQTLNSLGTTDTKAVIDGLFAKIGSFSAGAEQYDDIGMVCFKYHGRKE
ncbi:MAG: serine/threonine-protein phosphatase [Ruminococcus sp.]|nr:serine/threonine-protein phosphatase [Ruminococcus sp.]